MTNPRNNPRTMGFTELRRWLRHRHPMVLLDRILDYEPKRSLTGLLSVSGSLDCIAGHFPDRAIYPGSNLIQAFSQCGIILFQISTSRLADDELTLAGRIEARFFKIVVPGDQVVLNVTVEDLTDKVLHFSGIATVNEHRVAALRANIIRVKTSALEGPLW